MKAFIYNGVTVVTVKNKFFNNCFFLIVIRLSKKIRIYKNRILTVTVTSVTSLNYKGLKHFLTVFSTVTEV